MSNENDEVVKLSIFSVPLFLTLIRPVKLANVGMVNVLPELIMIFEFVPRVHELLIFPGLLLLRT